MQRRRIVSAASAAVLALITPVAFLASPAHAADPGNIQGQVDFYNNYWDENDGLPGIQAQAHLVSTDAAVGDAVTTTSDGAYEIDGLPSGVDYYVTLTDPNGGYVSQNTASITVPEDDTAFPDQVNLSPDPAQLSTLTGTVTAPGETDPSDCLRAYAYLAGANTPIASVWASSSGVISFTGLPKGSYKVRANEYCRDYPDVWAASAPTWDAATSFAATPSGTSFGTIALTPGKIVSGTILTTANKPIVDIDVALYTVDGSYIDETETDATGTYSFTSVAPGSYKIEATDDIGDYAPRWYANGTSLASATTVTVTASANRSGLTIKLPSAGFHAPTDARVTGIVQNDAGQPIRGATAYLCVVSGTGCSWSNSASTHLNGAYYFTGVPAGKVRLQFYGDKVVSQYYRGKYSSKSATLITLGSTGKFTAATVRLTRYGTVTGKITLPAVAGTNALNSSITAYDVDGDDVDGTSIAANGSYSLSLEPGTYFIRAYGERYSTTADIDTSFIPEYYGSKYTFASAKAIKVGPGGTVKSINVTLGRTLLATGKPAIGGAKKGVIKVGKKATASPGVWNRMASTQFSYTWKVGSKVVSHSASYKPTKKDKKKKKLTLTVAATDKYGTWLPGKASVTVKIK